MQTKPIFSVLAALCLTMGSGQAQTTLTNGLVAYWPLDVVNVSGGVTNTPDLALGNNMTVFGGITPVPGEQGNCFTFAGASQYLDVMHSTNNVADGLPFYTTNGYTVAFWVRGLSTQGANHIPLSEVAYAGSMLLDFNTRSTNIGVFLRDNAGTTVINNVPSHGVVFDTTGTTWHFVAFTDLNGACKLYIDGNPDSANVNYTAASSGAPAATITTIGSLVRSSGVADGFTGSVDEVMAWNRVLSPTEIQSAMSGIPEPILPTPPTFVTPPVGSTNSMGDRAMFSANVFGNQPITYQWYTNGVAVPGQTTSTLTLTTLTEPGTNTVTLLAANSAGTNSSTPVDLVVLPDGPTNLDSGLVSYWPFNVLSNSSTDTPDLVSQNDFQLVNMSGANLVPGEFGNALSFDGATQYGSETTGTPIYDVSTTYTVAFWVNGAGSQSGYRIIFANGNPATGQYFLIGNDPGGASGKLDVRPNPGTGDVLSTGTALDGTWHQVTWVDQNGTGLLYIDGVLDPTVFDYTRSSFTLSNTTVGALLDTASPQYYFAGNIDELGTWNRRLSYTEIQAMVAHGIPAPPVIVGPSVSAPTTNYAGTVYQGDTISMSVSASGTAPLSYQWYVGTNKISGANNPTALTNTLVLANVQPNQSGSYSVVITNAAHSGNIVTSSVVPLTVVPYVPATSGTALQVEFNWAAGPVVQPGFSSMTLSQNPASFGGPQITLSPIGATSLSDRERTVPVNNPPALTTADIYQEFIFSTATTPETGIDVFIKRLAPNTSYGLTVWSYDQENSGASDWTINGSGSPVTMGTPGFPFYDFTGNPQPTANYQETMGALVTSSATGTLDIQGVVDPYNSVVAVFLNAMVLTANPVIRITGATITNGNLQISVSTQYANEAVTFMESPSLTSPNWQPAGDMISSTTAGPTVTALFPISATQNFYEAVYQP